MFFKTQEIKVEELEPQKRYTEEEPGYSKKFEVRQKYSMEDYMVISRISYPVQITIKNADYSLSTIFRGEKHYLDNAYSTELITSRNYRRRYGKDLKWGESGFMTIITPYHMQEMGLSRVDRYYLSTISDFLAGRIPVIPGEFVVQKADSTYYPNYVETCFHNYLLTIDELRIADKKQSTIKLEYGAKHDVSEFLGYHEHGYDYVEFKGNGKIRVSFERPKDWHRFG